MKPKKALHKSQFHLNMGLILVSATLVGAASILVVLTSMAVNMISATGDFNLLVNKWNQQNLKAERLTERYINQPDSGFVAEYEELKASQALTTNIITELFKRQPQPERIIHEFDSVNINPNEISGLINAFRFFNYTDDIDELQRNWRIARQLNGQKSKLTDRIFTERMRPDSEERKSLQSEITLLNRQIASVSGEMYAKAAGLSLTLKRFSLWLTVLLGIMIVFSGILFTVRGLKSLHAWEKVLGERDYLARFPKLNQYPVLHLDKRGNIEYLNPSAQKLLPGIHEMRMDHPFLEPVKQLIGQLHNYSSDQKVLREVKLNKHWYQQSIYILPDENGILIHCIDITELKEKEDKLTQSLNEKNILLAEIHHRVKNNMAVISGLLDLQEMMGVDPKIALKESRARIKSMAIIHEMLYQSDSFSNINLRDYTASLLNHLKKSHLQDDRIKLQESVQEINLNINQAIPLGLIINELIVNAIQHAFADTQGNNNTIGLDIRQDKNLITLCIEDNGRGLPEDFDLRKPDSMGFTLINTLKDQLEADLNIRSNGTTQFILSFKQNEKKGSGSALLSESNITK